MKCTSGASILPRSVTRPIVTCRTSSSMNACLATGFVRNGSGAVPALERAGRYVYTSVRPEKKRTIDCSHESGFDTS